MLTLFVGPVFTWGSLTNSGNATAVMGQVDQALIDRIFSATQLLNRESMQYFVEQLIQAREWWGRGRGRGYS